MPASRGPSKSGTPTGGRSGPAPLPSSRSPGQNSPADSPVGKMQNLSVSIKPPSPSGPGKGGELLKVLSNHFMVNPNALPEFIYKWNVEIRLANSGQNPGPVVGRVKRRVLELLLLMPGFNVGVYSDFTLVLWSFKTLTQSQTATEVVIVDYYEPEESGPRTGAQRLLYQVHITSAMPRLPSTPLKNLFADPGQGTVISRPVKDYEDFLNQCLLKYAATNNKLTTAQRGTKIFPKEPNFPAGSTPKRQVLGGGLTAYRGYERRAKIVQGGIMVALTTTTSAMYEEGRASDLIANWRRAHPGQPGRVLDSFIRGVRVQGLFGPRRVKPILSVVSGNAQSTTFQCDTHPKTQATVNRRVNVVWFFKEAYGIDLSPTGLVLNVGTAQRSIIWPAELCQVLPAQAYKTLLPLSSQAQAMIRFACRQPAANSQLILSEGLQMLGVNLQGGTVNGTPIKLLLQMATVPARRIASPSLIFGGQSMLSSKETAKGQWNLQGRRFLKSPTGPTKFTVIVLKRKSESGLRNLQEFRDAIKTGLRAYCGINETCTSVPQVPDTLDWQNQNPVDWLKSLFNHCGKASGVCYCFLIVSEREWYNIIKEAADSVGMQTTVTLRQGGNSVKTAPGFIANLALKYSMKTQGVNWNLAPPDFGKILDDQPTMLLGLDVVHPPPGAMKSAPSVAGLVYSIAASPGQFLPYVNLLQADEGRKAREVVPTGSLRPMVEHALRGWLKHNNGGLPRRIFMTRDGVSDTQLQQVLDVELPAIKQAANKVYGEHKQTSPEVFILNTNKRHITRFFRAKDDTKGTAFDPHGNPLPGLIVDQRITSRTTDDWYAVSHKCLQGTSRPAHHVRLFDEIHLSKSDLQRLVHNLSFIYPRSVTSVSIPTPAKLADRLCERAKTRMHPVYFPSEEDQGRTWSINGPWFKGQQDVHPRIRDTMYYI